MAYRFIETDDVRTLGEGVFVQAHATRRKSTVLLAPEGSNLSLARCVTTFRGGLKALQHGARFAALGLKCHHAERRPFARLLLRLQREIVRMNRPTVVSYCTGGIRCEKAALWTQHAGVPQGLQRHAGMLRCFKQTTDAPNWQGPCVVFDARHAVDTMLSAAAA